MRSLIISSIGVGIMYLIHRWRYLYFSMWFYIFAFSLGMILMTILGACEIPEGYIKMGSIYDYKPNYVDSCMPCFGKDLTSQQRKKYTKKRDFELREAKRCEKEGLERCWWIPCMDDRDVTRAAVTTFISGVTCITQKSGALAMMLTAFAEYSFSCIDEYYYIREKLQWAKYHYDTYEWYQYVLDNV